jgi:hypothetical protein
MLVARWLAAAAAALAAAAGVLVRGPQDLPPRTVAEVVTPVLPRIEATFAPVCQAAGVPWPPQRLQVLAFKQERSLEVWAAGLETGYVRLTSYPVLAASGGLGPKRREGDRQVPEGFYRLSDLNPNSAFFLSLRVDYPNETDRARSKLSLREMGGDIFVHGRAVSRGCLAIGDDAIEELFALASLVPAEQRRILIAPVDFRTGAPAPPADERWVRDLYASMRTALEPFRAR